MTQAEQSARLTGIKRIRQAEETQAESLNLRDLTFRDLPEEIGSLSSLKHFTAPRKIRGIKSLLPLTAIESLDLSECTELFDFAPLSSLVGLRLLNLSCCEQLMDLTPIQALSSLEFLNISFCIDIFDLRPLRGLTSLKSLNIGWCGGVSDLSPLQGLTSLEHLNLSVRKNLSDISPIGSLQSLRLLNISGSKLKSLAPLTNLKNIEVLDLSDCEQIDDLAPLIPLFALRYLDLSGCSNIGSIGPLGDLTGLKSLNLKGCIKVTDLNPLGNLANLESLRLDHCKQVDDLRPLASLSSLKTLRIRGLGPTLLRFEPTQTLLPHLEWLDLEGSIFTDLDPYISNADKKTLDAVRAHYADLAAGTTDNSETKLILLGNGGAGKTQLARALRNLPFDQSVPSTHGIQIHESDLILDDPSHPIHLNLWDFGGQEVYHGSHALFLQGRAVFVIVWTPPLEDATPYQEQGIPMRHRPLAYWLDFVRAFSGTTNPVIVVQSQCDTGSQRAQRPFISNVDGFTSLRFIQVSARTGYRIDELHSAIKGALRDSFEQSAPIPLGIGRARVRQRLRELLDEDRERYRTLDRAAFERICEEAGGVSSPAALLDFLHHTGAIFYRAKLFGGRIVLDQNWALEAVYTVFDRTRTLPLLRGHGRFTRAELDRLVWSAYTVEEQELFLTFMLSCGICFKARRLPGGDREYIAPELLPDRAEASQSMLLGRIPASPPDVEATAHYGFLHEGVLRNYLSRIGHYAENAAFYWRYGCWLYEQKSDSCLLIESKWENPELECGPGTIAFKSWGSNARSLVDPLLAKLTSLTIGQRPEVTWQCEGLRREEVPWIDGTRIDGNGLGSPPTRPSKPKTTRPLRIRRQSRRDSFLSWAPANRVTLAIVFTDIVDSTRTQQLLRDHSMTAVRHAHFAKARALIKRYGGNEVKTIGDSFMVAFFAVDAALGFALELRANPGSPELQIRAGIHVGQVEVEEWDAFGGNVNLASRVAGHIKGPEVWLSDRAKRDLDQAGPPQYRDLQWQEHTSILLKGFEDTHTLWELKQ